MKNCYLLFAILVTATVASAQQRLVPDGNGGFVIQSTPDFSAYGPQESEQQLKRQQVESLRLQNEILRQQVEQNKLDRQAQQDRLIKEKQQQVPSTSSATPDYQKLWSSYFPGGITPEFRAWKSENTWFGTDRARTEFSLLYAKQLRQDKPELVGRDFFETVSNRVKKAFDGVN